MCSFLQLVKVQCKVDAIRNSSLNAQAGLGSPPDKFYTNASEAVQNELPDLLKEVCEEEEQEVERAVVGRLRGKYQLQLWLTL